MVSAINVAQTGLSPLSLVIGHSLYRSSVRHNFTMQFNEPFIIYCIFTLKPPTTQLVASPFIATSHPLKVHHLIISAHLFPLNFLHYIYVIINFISIHCGWKSGPCNILKIVLGEIFTHTPLIFKEFNGSIPFHNYPYGYNCYSSPGISHRTPALMWYWALNSGISVMPIVFNLCSRYIPL